LKISFILDTLLEPQKIRFLMLKRRQDGPPKFPIFLKKRQKILALTVLGPRCLLEASKRPPRPSQEPPRATQEPPRAAQEPRKRRPRALKRHLSPDMGASWAQGARCQVSGEEILQAAASPVRSFPCKRQDTMF